MVRVLGGHVIDPQQHLRPDGELVTPFTPAYCSPDHSIQRINDAYQMHFMQPMPYHSLCFEIQKRELLTDVWSDLPAQPLSMPKAGNFVCSFPSAGRLVIRIRGCNGASKDCKRSEWSKESAPLII